MAERRRKRRRSRWVIAAPVLLGVAAAAVTLVADTRNGLLALLSLRSDVGEVAERVRELESRRAALRSEVQALRTDPLAIEAAARAQGLVRPGEIVVRLED